ncbi:MAG: hypothetical protein LBM70_01810 [Victivallales bacterium]|jgi:hypothetical protein|nr:hypothetical protein [Victivallales bacterium]
MKKPHKIAFITLLTVGLGAILLFFFLTGSFFLTTVVLPFASRQAGVDIAAERVEWSLFRSRLRLNNLCIGSAERPDFVAESAETRYSLWALTGGVLKLSDAKITRAKLVLYHDYDNNRIVVRERNVTALAAPKGRKTTFLKSLMLDLNRIAFADSSFKLIFGDPDAGSAIELFGIDLFADRFADNQPLRLKAAGNLRLASSRANHIDTGKFQIELDGTPGKSLIPKTFKTKCSFSDLFGVISGVPFNDGAINVAFEGNLESNSLELKNLALTQSQGGTHQSDMTLSGRIGFAPFELQAKVDTCQLSEAVTSLLFDLGFGFNPGRAVVQYNGNFFYGKRKLVAEGMLRVDRTGDAIFDLERISLPPLQLDGQYDFMVDLEDSTIDLKKFAMTLQEKGNESAVFRLRRPIRYSWQTIEQRIADRAVFDLECRAFDLKLLRFLFPGDSEFRFDTGTLSGRMQLTLKHNLSAFSLLGSGRISNGIYRREDRKIALSEIIAGLDAELRRDFHWTLRNLSLALKNHDMDLGNANFSGEGKLTERSGNFSGHIEGLTSELAVLLFPALEPLSLEYRRLKLGTAEVQFKLEKTAKKEPLYLREFTAGIKQDNLCTLELKIDPCQLDGTRMSPQSELKLHLNGEFPISTVNSYLSKPIQFESGKVKVTASGAIAGDRDSAIFSGELAFDELAAKVQDRDIQGISAQCSFSCNMPSKKRIEFRTLNFYLRCFGKPALRLECPGSWDLDRDNYSGEWAIRYLNEQLLNLPVPGMVSEAQLSGYFQVAAGNNFQVLRASGSLNLEKLIVSKYPGTVYSGAFSLMSEKDLRKLAVRHLTANLKQNKERLFDLTGEGQVDLSSPAGAVTVQLASTTINAGKLLSMFSTYAKGETASLNNRAGDNSSDNSNVNPESAIPKLNFGQRPMDIGCHLQDIRFTPKLAVDLDTRIRLQPDSFLTDHLLLQINNARYNGQITGANTAGGILFGVELHGGEVLFLPPLLELIVGNSQQGVDGTLRDLNLKLRFLENGDVDSYLKTMTGSLMMNFRNLEIPGNVTAGPFGRLLLFPVELTGQLNSLLPEELAAWKDSVISSDELKKQLKTIQLDEGSVRLHANAGKVRVNECVFWGDWVSRLAFFGDFDLARGQKLNLTSRLTVGGVQTVIPIEGTLNNPSVRMESIASGSLGELLKKIKELNLIGTSADPSNPNKIEPVILIDKLPSAGTIKELQELFKQLWKN